MTDGWIARTRRQIRVVSILAAAHEAGIAPVPAGQLHTIAYLADAMAPVWGLKIFDAHLLKRREGPMSPALQHDADLLVARGVVFADSVRHVPDEGTSWRLDARYSLNLGLAAPILAAAASFPQQATQLAFVEEVVNAVAGLGLDGISRATSTDAAYSDVVVDFGGLLDLGGSQAETNLSAQVALRFGHLSSPSTRLTSAEMVHLYVRELYSRLTSVA